jgi:hypothetical protein
MRPVILALDISKHCGWAIWETDRDFSSIECGVFEFPEKATIEYCADQMGLKVTDLIRKYRERHAYFESYVDDQGNERKRKKYAREINFAVIEMAKKAQLKGSGSTISSCFLHGAVLATLSNFGIAWGVIADSTWRKMHFGEGWKPEPKVTVDRKTGQKKYGDPDWKGAAIRKCEDEGIQLPSLKATRDNAAEAALVAICWRGAKILAGRYHDRFQAFLQTRNNRSERNSHVGGDLFGGAAA